MLQHRELYPQLHFQSLNSRIDLADSPLRPSLEHAPWPDLGGPAHRRRQLVRLWRHQRPRRPRRAPRRRGRPDRTPCGAAAPRPDRLGQDRAGPEGAGPALPRCRARPGCPRRPPTSASPPTQAAPISPIGCRSPAAAANSSPSSSTPTSPDRRSPPFCTARPSLRGRRRSPSSSRARARSIPAWAGNCTRLPRSSAQPRPLRRHPPASPGRLAGVDSPRSRRTHRPDGDHPAGPVRPGVRPGRIVDVLGHPAGGGDGPQHRGICSGLRRRLLRPGRRSAARRRARPPDERPPRRRQHGRRLRPTGGDRPPRRGAGRAGVDCRPQRPRKCHDLRHGRRRAGPAGRAQGAGHPLAAPEGFARFPLGPHGADAGRLRGVCRPFHLPRPDAAAHFQPHGCAPPRGDPARCRLLGPPHPPAGPL